MKTLKQLLLELKACDPAIEWALIECNDNALGGLCKTQLIK
jgi:hypothetical protein